MNKRLGKRILAVLLSALALLGMSGCVRDDDPGVISGGKIDKTDDNAPKVIYSKEITEFYAGFFLFTRQTADGTQIFRFEVKSNDSGALTAYENTSGISAPADAGLMTALQEVIDGHKLAEQNGIYRITAGLEPETQYCELRVSYASGETLSFTLNNDPRAEWAEDMYDVFADWFSGKGDYSLYSDE